MATRDIWKPGYKFARTLKGRETMIPDNLSLEAEAAYLLEADEAYDSDPAKQALEKRNARRRELWDREQAPARAWRAHFQARYLDAETSLPDDFDHEAERAAFIANFKKERRAKDARAGKLQPADVNEARQALGLTPDDLRW